jgi:hypothetical protein
MKRIFFILIVCFSTSAFAQERIRVPANLLLQLKIPIQPTDKSWAKWNFIPSLQDSTKTIRIDRMVQGNAPFIPREDAPYYSAVQIKEIQLSLEKILNPDGYFTTQEEYLKYSREIMERWVFVNGTGK